MYTEITIDQFREFLKAEKGWKETSPAGQEAYFDFPKSGFMIRVHSSIFRGLSRDRGQDAIRVSVVLATPEKTMGIKKFSRVTRQENWKKNLKERVMEAFAYISTIKKCPQCGSVLAERKSKESGNRFLSCTRYPDCRYTEDL